MNLADLFLEATFSYRRTLKASVIDAFRDSYYTSNQPGPSDHLVPALLHLARTCDPDEAVTIHHQLALGDYTQLIDIYNKLDSGEIVPIKRGRPRSLLKSKIRPSRAGQAATRRAKATARIIRAAKQPLDPE